MSPSRLARLLTVPIGTALLLMGVLAPFGRSSVADAGNPRTVAPPSLQAASGPFEEKPLAAEAVTTTAQLTVSIVPEKVRLRFGVREGSSDATADVEAARPPSTWAPVPRTMHDVVPARRLAERAGRAAAPSTAPPAPTT